MRKQLRAALATILAELVPGSLGPQYARVRRLPRGEGWLVVPGEIVYADTSRPGTGRFICFIPDQKRNAFTIELAWSADGQFPRATARPNMDPAMAAARRPHSGFVRLAELYTRLGTDWDLAPLDPMDPGSLDRFMELELRELGPEEAAALVRPLVEDAIRTLQTHAAPFLDSVAR